MDQNEYKETIVKDRQQERKELPQTRDLRRFVRRKDMQPKKIQLQNLHYKIVKYEKRIVLLEQKLDAFDRRLIEMEDFIVELIEKEEKEKPEYKVVKEKVKMLPVKGKKTPTKKTPTKKAATKKPPIKKKK